MIKLGDKLRALPEDSRLLIKMTLTKDDNSKIIKTTTIKDQSKTSASLIIGRECEGIIKKWWREQPDTAKITMI